MALYEFSLYLRLMAPAFLLWLAWIVHRAPYQDRSNQVLATFLGLVAVGFVFEFLWDFLGAVSPIASSFFRLAQRLVGYLDPPVLFLYAAIFPRPRPWARSPWIWSAFGAAALGLLLWGVPYVDEASHALVGYPSFARAESLYVNLTYLLAFLVLLDGFARERRRYLARQLSFLCLGVGFVAISRGAAPFFFVAAPELAADPWTPLASSLLLGLGLLGLAVVLQKGVQQARDVRSPRPIGPLAGSIFLLLAFFFGTWSVLGVFAVPLGTWRILAYYYGLRWVFFGLPVAYGILRYQLFDFELRTRQTLVLLVTLFGAPVLAVLVGLTAQQKGAGLIEARLYGMAAGVAFALLMYVVLNRLVGLLLPWEATQGQEELRRLEVYEATLEYALRRPEWSPEEQRFVDTLREVLRISSEDHERVMARLRGEAEAPAPAGRTSRAPAP